MSETHSPRQINTPLRATHLLLDIISQLRHPITGCPWDLKQTHQTLSPYLLEEAYEAVEAIESQDPEKIKDELGDVLLQVVLHAQLAKEANQFDFEAIAETLGKKMVERHPHVFAPETLKSDIETPEAVNQQWDQLKATAGSQSIWEKPPKHLPALMQANKLSKAAVKEGFKWPNLKSLWKCVQSEVDEVKETLPIETEGQSKERQEEEIGDLLFALASLSGHLDIDPEVALFKASNKFLSRYKTLKTLTIQPIKDHSFEALDDLWKQAKQLTQK